MLAGAAAALRRISDSGTMVPWQVVGANLLLSGRESLRREEPGQP